jgi:hypothetical protein
MVAGRDGSHMSLHDPLALLETQPLGISLVTEAIRIHPVLGLTTLKLVPRQSPVHATQVYDYKNVSSIYTVAQNWGRVCDGSLFQSNLTLTCIIYQSHTHKYFQG